MIDSKVLAEAHKLVNMQPPWLESIPPIAIMFARALIEANKEIERLLEEQQIDRIMNAAEEAVKRRS